MISTHRRSFIIGVLLLFWGVVGFILLRPEPPLPAPDITFNIIDGRKLALGELRGRPVLINFWASSCRTCLEDMPEMVSLYQEFSEQGLEIVAVTIFYDPPSNALQVVKDKQLPYPVAIDILADAAKAFGSVKVTPTTFLVDPSGYVVDRMLGKIDFRILKKKLSAMLPTANKPAEE